MRKVLPRSFFNRPTQKVARELLGKFVVRHHTDGHEEALMITEVEAYDGPHDRASHAFRGLTPRTAPLFEEAGLLYIYFIYGMHHMLNVTTREAGYPGAVLIRGTDKITGPGRVAKHLLLDRTISGKPAARISGVWFEDRGARIPRRAILRTPRIGVAYAGPIWSKKLYRFLLKN